jgi:uncharacterized membrane protein HdeD (DUF308 family)
VTATHESSAPGWQWTLLAGIIGFLVSFVFSTVLHFPRAYFVAAYSVIAGAFFVAYARSQHLNVRTQLERRWVAGLIAGLVIGAALMRQVYGQPASPRAEGLTLAWQLGWYGIVYGVVDALLLSVVPVLCLYGSRPRFELQRTTLRFQWAAVALLASSLVTAAYHAGFSEFRGSQLMQPVIGNLIITVGYLLTGSPIAALVAHVLMHIAAVAHGMTTTMQLPPH